MNKKLFRGVILDIILLNCINGARQDGVHGYAILQRLDENLLFA